MSDWIPLSQREKLSIPRMLAMSAGSFLNSINWNLIFQLSTPIMDRLNITGTKNACVFLAGIILVFFLQPIFSAFSDQSTFKWGRRRIYLIVSAVMCLIGMLGVAFCGEIGDKCGSTQKSRDNATLAIFIITILFWYAGAAIYGGPMRAIVSDNCPEHQQVWIANMYNIVGAFTGIFTSLLGAFEVYKSFGFDGNEKFLLLVGIIFGAAALTITCVANPEEPLREKPADAKNPMIEIVQNLRTIPKPALIADLFYLCFQGCCYEKGTYESKFWASSIYKGDQTTGATQEQKDLYQEGLSFFFWVSFALNCINFAYSWVNSWVVGKLGYRMCIFVSMILYSTGLILLFFITQKIVCLLIWLILFSFPSTIACTVPGAIVSLSVPSSSLGSHLAILNSFCVAGQIFANVVVGMGLGNFWDFKPNIMIGSGCVLGVIGVFFGWLIIIPSREVVNDLSDNVNESSSSDRPDSL